MHAVAERLRIGTTASTGRPIFKARSRGQQDSAAALRLDEPEPRPVVGPGEPRVADAFGPHHLGIGGGRHVTETDDAL
ncbi:putative fatty acid synthase [Mycobacterium xenopi 4042]|uniref:Putative fatty acid synthase n=1 Tax=Mycobacterium xenopi 4042 TaxID=1299334 RepID=X8E2R0_MYCXE|nr:putative fatty acid synthase [Mycobacterium xenopi 4042]